MRLITSQYKAVWLATALALCMTAPVQSLGHSADRAHMVRPGQLLRLHRVGAYEWLLCSTQ